MTRPGSAAEGSRARRSWQTAIAAVGHAYPAEVVDNDEYLRRSRAAVGDPAVAAERSRMISRNWCGPDETAWTLARRACLDALSGRPDLSDRIDVVIAVSATSIPFLHPCEPDRTGQADLAPLVVRDVLRRDCLSLDLKGNCAGFLRAVELMDGLLDTSGHRAGLIVCAERTSAFATAETNRSSFCFILGDAAAAVVLERRPHDAPAGIIDCAGTTHVDTLDLIALGPDGRSMVMLGSRAGAAVVDFMAACAADLLARNGLLIEDVDWFLPVQGHRDVVAAVADRLGCPESKLLWTADVHGFSGSASIPACLGEHVDRGVVRPGDLILSAAVGAGLNSAGVLFRY